ncbi:hypothetical protein BU15DRAFT_42310 [Melanogaster broomeanus]|nr:hypothetical protein BU15DRAFT_42310 [Melanogaster broomeanus]
MSDDSRLKLIEDLKAFAQHGTRRALRDFQCIGGYLNWALNVYPLLRPGLCAIYGKTAGKLQQRAPLWINKDVERELNWVIQHLQHSDGVYFLKSVSWSYRHLPSSVLRVYCDASPLAMAYWFPTLRLAFQSNITEDGPNNTIFFFEALTVCAAIHEATSRTAPGERLAVFTDNLNTVQMFNSLATLPTMNWLLMDTVDCVSRDGVDFRVFHVSGVKNTVADHLSRLRNQDAIDAVPGLSIHTFQPPRCTLGAAKK